MNLKFIIYYIPLKVQAMVQENIEIPYFKCQKISNSNAIKAIKIR